MQPERIWTAALVVIGDEILSGRTQDKNIAQLAGWLTAHPEALMTVTSTDGAVTGMAELPTA